MQTPTEPTARLEVSWYLWEETMRSAYIFVITFYYQIHGGIKKISWSNVDLSPTKS